MGRGRRKEMLIADGGDECGDMNTVCFCQVLFRNGTGGYTTLKAFSIRSRPSLAFQANLWSPSHYSSHHHCWP